MNAERNAAICELRRGGLWPAEIARDLKLSRNVVAGVLDRADLTQTGCRRALSGEENAGAKLTAAAVREIRRTYKPRSAGYRMVDFARRYGVGPTTISKIVHRRTWAHVR